jgi:hypothetical protein
MSGREISRPHARYGASRAVASVQTQTLHPPGTALSGGGRRARLTWAGRGWGQNAAGVSPMGQGGRARPARAGGDASRRGRRQHRFAMRHLPARGQRDRGAATVAADQPPEPARSGASCPLRRLRFLPALSASFLTQVTQAFCGVASSVAVLNASAAQAPDRSLPALPLLHPMQYLQRQGARKARPRHRGEGGPDAGAGDIPAQRAAGRHRDLLPRRPGPRRCGRGVERARLRGGAFGGAVPSSRAAHPEPQAAIRAGQLLARDAQRRQRAAVTSRRWAPITPRPTACW